MVAKVYHLWSSLVVYIQEGGINHNTRATNCTNTDRGIQIIVYCVKPDVSIPIKSHCKAAQAGLYWVAARYWLILNYHRLNQAWHTNLFWMLVQLACYLIVCDEEVHLFLLKWDYNVKSCYDNIHWLLAIPCPLEDWLMKNNGYCRYYRYTTEDGKVIGSNFRSREWPVATVWLVCEPGKTVISNRQRLDSEVRLPAMEWAEPAAMVKWEGA